MAYTESTMLPLGSAAPDFLLPDTVSGKMCSLKEVAGTKATLIIFSCNHCPYVVHVNPEIVRIAHKYIPKGVGIVAISANDAEKYPDDAPDKMTMLAKEASYFIVTGKHSVVNTPHITKTHTPSSYSKIIALS